ncbi:MAG: phosphatase PAP2 family protein [Gaiellales bacterium]
MRQLPPPIRMFAMAVWLAAFVISTSASGLPTRRSNVIVWVVLAIVALGIDRPRTTLRSFLTRWLPLFAALAAYDILRGMSDSGDQASAHTWPHLDIDLWLGGGITPSAWLQARFWDPLSPHLWDYAAWLVYQSHFFVPLLVAVILWYRRHHLDLYYMIGLVVLSWLALATYALYPAQPPWMVARDDPSTGEVARVVQQMWRDVGVDRAARVFTTEAAAGSRYSNPVAALPSLHAAFPMFIAVMMWGAGRGRNIVLAAYALAMGFVLVYAGEHFTFDILLGWIYAAAVALAARAHQSRRPPMVATSLADSQEAVGGVDGSELEPVAAGASRSR